MNKEQLNKLDYKTIKNMYKVLFHQTEKYYQKTFWSLCPKTKDKKLVVLFLIREKLLDKLATEVLLRRYEHSDDIEIKAALLQYQHERFGTGSSGDQ